MEPLTMFTWGYWGWGTSTKQLLEAVDAVEASRGYTPPIFVDIRISRAVRAPGFNGNAFEKAVGASRYRWLDALGNLAIQEGGELRIKDPTAAETLLEVAESCSRSGQRILFFCSCEFPGVEGQKGCHRVTVARLVLEAAQRRKLPLRIVEWPGGSSPAEGLEVHLSEKAFGKVARGAKSIPLEEPVALAKMAAVPWFSVVAVRRKGDDERPPFYLVTGPARYKNAEWYLPIYADVPDDQSREETRRQIKEVREDGGFEARQAQT